MPKLQIFPHVLCRIGGLPFEVLKQFTFSEYLQGLFDRQIELENKLELYKIEVLENLKAFKPTNFQFSTIRKIKKKVYKNQILELSLIHELEENIKSKLLIYNDLLNKKKVLSITIKEYFEAELLQHKINLQQLAQHPNFQNALPLSSISFAKSLQRYLDKSPKDFRKKELQTERTVMQYITRMAAKTSPFSSFTPLCYGQITDKNKAITSQKNETKKSKKQTSFVAFNTQILQLLQACFVANTRISGFLNIRLNQTLERQKNEYRYLVNVGNVEAFQTLEKQPILALIESVFVDNQRLNKVLTINETVDVLLDEIEAERLELLGFVQELMEIGFLEIDFKYHGNTENWLEKVTEFVEETPVFDTDDLHLFQGLQQKLMNFNQYNYGNNFMKSRILILEKVHQQIQYFFDKYNFEIDLQKVLPPEQLIYEDVALNVKLNFEKEKVQQLIESLNGLLEQLNFIQGKEKLQIQYFFNQYYIQNQGDIIIPLLDFYENYYKIGKKIKEQEIPTIQREAEILKKWMAAVGDLVTLKYEKGQDLELKVADFQLINKKVGISLIPLKQVSLACFAQVYREEKELKAVLNAVTSGYGKMTGRFLNLMPSKFTDDLKSFNVNLSDTVLMSDNVDASFFNANRHPSLFDYEISMPESQNQLPKNQQLNVKDLAVRNVNQKLVLWHQVYNCEVKVFDLGIQTPKGRSPLYRLLMNFSPIIPNLQYLKSIIQQTISEITLKENKDKTIIYPAVLFKEWCLMRSCVYAPNLEIMKKIKRLPEIEKYQKIRNWQAQKNIKKYNYIKKSLSKGNNEDEKRNSKKPLYYDFNNMIIFNSLLKSVKEDENIYELMEMFPEYEKLLTIGNKKFFMECVFQWYLYQ